VAETRERKERPAGESLIAKNRRASFDYAIEETFEAGIALVGSEVKSIRAGKIELVDAYAVVEQGELWLKQMYVAPFSHASAFPHEPRRARKLLVRKREIERIGAALAREGLTLVPMRIFLRNGFVKVELGLGKGRKKADKRQEIARKTADREARAEMGRGRKGS
jgi:SsrA-binding protein